VIEIAEAAQRLTAGVQRMKSLLTHDHIVWTLGLIAAVIGFAATLTHLVPAAYVAQVREIAALVAFVSAYLKTSPLPGSKG
jgi:Trk-type K+ transport system membrane component